MPKKKLNPDDLRVLILAPTGQDAALIQGALTTAGLTCLICRSLSEVSQSLGTGVGAVLLAAEALQPKPLREFVSVLQDQAPWSDIPITLLTPPGTAHQAVRRIPEDLRNVGNVSIVERRLQPFTLVSVMRVALRSRSRQYEVRDLVERLQASQNELYEKISDLERFQDAVVGRELKMMELEKQLEELKPPAVQLKDVRLPPAV